MPNGGDVDRYYPRPAAAIGAGGRTVLICQVDANGFAQPCRIISETPADLGFGEAAMKLATLFRMEAQTKDGKPVAGGSVRIPIRFEPAQRVTLDSATKGLLARREWQAVKASLPQEWDQLLDALRKAFEAGGDGYQATKTIDAFNRDFVLRHQTDIAGAPPKAIRQSLTAQVRFLDALEKQNVALCARVVMGMAFPSGFAPSPTVVQSAQDTRRATFLAMVEGAKVQAAYGRATEADNQALETQFEKRGGDPGRLALVNSRSAAALSYGQVCDVRRADLRAWLDLPDAVLGRLWTASVAADRASWVVPNPAG